jgi:hypothetical protein
MQAVETNHTAQPCFTLATFSHAVTYLPVSAESLKLSMGTERSKYSVISLSVHPIDILHFR